MNQFKEARTRFNLADVVSKFVKLKSSGSDFIGNCPFHKEDTPSFRVYTRSDTYFCFGCHAWGDITDFLIRIGRPDLLDSLNSFSSDPFNSLMKKLEDIQGSAPQMTPSYVLKFIDKAITDTGYLMLDLHQKHKKLCNDLDRKFLLERLSQYRMVDEFFDALTPNFVTFLYFRSILSYLWEQREKLFLDLHSLSFQISYQQDLEGEKTLSQRYDAAVNVYQEFLQLFYSFSSLEFEN